MSQKLAEGDNFLRSLIDAIPLSLFVVDKDAHILECNHSACSFFEIEPGKYVRMGCGHALRCVHSMEKPGPSQNN
ncbi:MAG TPA: PAS domain-containing protein [Thermodesulfovibrionales bacterium]|nr:PAS domain-containing protein [Thermodesulfovibrionales bacterium]